MTFEDLQTLVEFHYWARNRLLAAVETLTDEQLRKNLGNSFPSIFDTVVHLYGADWIWRTRWNGESPTALPPPSGFRDLVSVRTAWHEEERRIRAFLRFLGPEGITRPIHYRGW